MKSRCSLRADLLSLLAALTLSAQEAKPQEPKLDLSQRFLLLDTSKGSTLQKEINEAANAANAPASVVVREGTAVKLKLLHTLNSQTAVADDPLNFTVAEEVLVEGTTVVKTGVVAIGRVQRAKPARTLGRGAELALEMQYMRVGELQVPLRGTQARTGEGKKGSVVALVVVFGLSGLIKHGSEIEVKEGSILTAYVDEDTKLQHQPERPGPGQGR